MKLLDKLKATLQKTAHSFATGITRLALHKKLDQYTLEQFEDLLIATDMGTKAANIILAELSKHNFQEISENEIKAVLKRSIIEIIKSAGRDNHLGITTKTEKPQVVLICGVNGNGKTTTAGKLGFALSNKNQSVVFAACDTFRAAAVEQLKILSEEIPNCKFIAGKENVDPASVAYTALQKAQQDHFDYLIIDTAGRLHNKINLMEELARYPRVLQKLNTAAPHETILVVDGTTGQSACSQIEIFQKFLKISGIIITKLDSGAKGGLVLNIALQHYPPIYALGTGEQIGDLIPFIAEDFAETLLN